MIRLIGAAFFGAIGLAGLLLPILPGWLFLGVSAVILFPEARLTKKLLDHLEKRMPSSRNLLRYFR